MASTNEDAVVLASSRLDDGRLLVMRHLPDRGTIEVGWWRQAGDGAVVQAPPVLELAAEAVEVDAFARLCERVASAGGDAPVDDGGEIAAAGPFPDGARLAALRTGGDEVTFVRHPDADDNRVRMPRAALEPLVATVLPGAARRLEALGFGLVQQGGPAPA